MQQAKGSYPDAQRAAMSQPKFSAAKEAKMSLSKQTKELLRKAQVKFTATGEPAPVEVVDSETGEVLRLNTITSVQRSRMPEGLQTSVQRDLIPEIAEAPDKAVYIQLVKQHQQRVVLQAMEREARREAMRSELLLQEHTKWRKDTMRKTFNAERIAAAEQLRQLKNDQEAALTAKLRELGMIRAVKG